MSPIKAPRLSYPYLANAASSFLDQRHPSRKPPVPIEKIVELEYRMDIIPMLGLQEQIDTVSFISQDLEAIYVDEFIYEQRENRYRFSLAHELAHRILHPSIFAQFEYDDLAGWKQATQAISDEDYRWLEWHANSFAGLVLVPPAQLGTAFDKAIAMAREGGAAWDDLSLTEEGERKTIEAYIAKEFNVSADVIEKRAEKDGLWEA